MLTERAQSYLASLKRLPAVPTSKVEKALHDQGYPCFDIWLDFHEQYAGYVEPLGLDIAIWGIVHEKSYWIGPGQVEVDRELYEETWYVTCAEVHPSYNYLLDNNGEFLGKPSESFDIYIERNAAVWAFISLGPSSRVWNWGELKDHRFVERLREDVIHCTVPAASDRYFRYYMNDFHLAVEDVETGRFVEAWKRE